MRVLIVMPLGEFGGGAEQMLATYLSGRHDGGSLSLHFLFFSDGALVATARMFGYPVEVVDAGRLRNFGKWIRTQRQIGRIMDIWGIERVLAWMPKAGFYLAWPVRMRGIPLLMWRHDIPTELEKLDRLVLQLGDVRAVACSSAVAQRAFHACMPEVESRAIHPAAHRLPVDTKVVSQIRELVLGSGNGKGPIIGTIARLQPWKRIDLLLESAALLRESYPTLRVVIVGGESHGLSRGHGEELKRLGRKLLGDSVVFTGEQRNVGNWLEAMDVFVLPSAGEPFGIVLVEALAAGKPVVACAGGGSEEIVTEETLGRVLVRDPTPQEMSEAISDLLDNSVRNQARIMNTKVAARFSPEVMVTKIDSWLGEVL